ncbi:MAG: hypothetical protein ACTHNE_04210 [Dyella sp.]|uniref:hypothetical protein n=1 Tax=Dyella sp. TaxID=1869338 RepID=UPI003F80EC0C
MQHARLPLLSHLRRHRGLWALAVAVLLFKLLTSSICLADPQASSASISGNAAQTSMVHASVPDDASCLLGEAGGCHCNCAHNMPLPAGMVLMMPNHGVSFTPAAASEGIAPEPTASLLRPPIAA